jgi:hypothetical protein
MPLCRRVATAALFLLCASVSSVVPAVAQTAALDNDAVVKLQKAGLGEDLIITTINSSPGHFDTSADALIALKQAGITDKEIAAMLSKNANPNGPAAMPPTIVLAAPPPPLPGITDVGVYYKDKDGNWQDVVSENVNFKTGGVLKTAFSDGIVKPDLNGHLTGPESKLKLNTPVEFAIYVMEGQSAGEYQLLHLHTHKDGREFRSVTGGVFHVSSGAERDTVDVQSKKVAPRVYLVTVEGKLAPGEYGFLPPTTMNSGRNLASSGQMYTFTVTE